MMPRERPTRVERFPFPPRRVLTGTRLALQDLAGGYPDLVPPGGVRIGVRNERELLFAKMKTHRRFS